MSPLVLQVRPMAGDEVSPRYRGCVGRARLAPRFSHRLLLPPSACLFYDACSIKWPKQHLQPRVICFLLLPPPSSPPSDVDLLQIRAATPSSSQHHQRPLICLPPPPPHPQQLTSNLALSIFSPVAKTSLQSLDTRPNGGLRRGFPPRRSVPANLFMFISRPAVPTAARKQPVCSLGSHSLRVCNSNWRN